MLHLNTYNELRFKQIWDDCDRYAAFKLAKDINPKLTDAMLDRSCQFITIFCEHYGAAKLQFVMMINDIC
jgi:hypothetical protein